MAPYKVGDVVFVVRSRSRNPGEVAITAIGRRWATLAGREGRFDIETGALDGGDFASPGEVYRSRDEWETKQALASTWSKFRQAVDQSWRPPVGATVEAIAQARALLGLEAK